MREAQRSTGLLDQINKSRHCNHVATAQRGRRSTAHVTRDTQPRHRSKPSHLLAHVQDVPPQAYCITTNQAQQRQAGTRSRRIFPRQQLYIQYATAVLATSCISQHAATKHEPTPASRQPRRAPATSNQSSRCRDTHQRSVSLAKRTKTIYTESIQRAPISRQQPETAPQRLRAQRRTHRVEDRQKRQRPEEEKKAKKKHTHTHTHTHTLVMSITD